MPDAGSIIVLCLFAHLVDARRHAKAAAYGHESDGARQRVGDTILPDGTRRHAVTQRIIHRVERDVCLHPFLQCAWRSGKFLFLCGSKFCGEISLVWSEPFRLDARIHYVLIEYLRGPFTCVGRGEMVGQYGRGDVVQVLFTDGRKQRHCLGTVARRHRIKESRDDGMMSAGIYYQLCRLLRNAERAAQGAGRVDVGECGHVCVANGILACLAHVVERGCLRTDRGKLCSGARWHKVEVYGAGKVCVLIERESQRVARDAFAKSETAAVAGPYHHIALACSQLGKAARIRVPDSHGIELGVVVKREVNRRILHRIAGQVSDNDA